MTDTAQIAEIQEVRRFDVLETSPSLLRSPEGFLEAQGVVAKVGILTYAMPDGSTRREFVSEDCLFSPDSMATCRMLPVTVGHPVEGDGFVRPGNSKRLSVGSTSDTPIRNDNYLQTGIKITAQEGLDAVERGVRQLSLGYKCEVVLTPGEWQGQSYDGYQRNRRYNHLALVQTARAGEEARIKLDGDSAMPENLVTVRLDGGLDYQAAPEVAAALTKAKAEADTFKVRLDEATAKIKEAENRAKTAESKLTDPATIAGLVATRLRIEKTAAAVMPEGSKFDGLDNEQLMAEAIKAWSPKINLDGQSPVYIAACFDAMEASMGEEEEEEEEDGKKKDMKYGKDKKDKKDKAMASQRKDALTPHLDAAPESPEAARQRMIARYTAPKQ